LLAHPTRIGEILARVCHCGRVDQVLVLRRFNILSRKRL
jgi:hypothetical protein